jgi:hypothetical protein
MEFCLGVIYNFREVEMRQVLADILFLAENSAKYDNLTLSGRK